ncbi:BglG family transcription antiterminator [Clostridium sp. BL-8]|uniref:BglG family transcription antiterminator n=1 Tax=Clostridium sp. BL-8 TaxID=349938 RepID=UPI00098BE698|nr:BglG family transcription antiterminator [Clostridium sp. BL-8]OOM80090.1 transcriptional regulator ManR [Clostridium sp. BL-8]
MYNLNVRQIEFLNLLLEEKQYKPIKYYTEFLNVSDKTLKKDLVVIEDYLSKYNVELDKKRSIGIMIKDVMNAKLILHNILQLQESKNEKISINNRRIEIIKYMLIDSHNSTSIQKLSDKYYVSKTSIVNDFKYIEKWLSSFKLKLEKTVEGTQIKGLEVNIRRAIASLLFEYSNGERNERTIEELATRLDVVTLNGLSELFEKDKIIYVNKLLLDLEKKYNCRIDEPYYINLLTHILISMIRGVKGRPIYKKEKGENFKIGKEYEEAVLCISSINRDFGMKLDEAEVYYLYQYFVSFGLIKEETENENKVINKLDYIAITFRDKMIQCIEEILQINITRDQGIMDKLLLHIRPMLNRMEYDIQISNPLINQIKEQYPVLLNICRVAGLMVSYELKQKIIPIDEIGYLTVYYQLGLENSFTKRRVLVVCHSGYGTSQLLSTKLNRHFPEFEIVESISASGIVNRNLDDIDFIISTVPLDLKCKPYLLVSTFLNECDVKNISDFLLNNENKNLKIPVTTKFIGEWLWEELIYFNKTENRVKKEIYKKLKKNITFNKIDFNRNLILQIGFCKKECILGLSMNDIENNEKQLTFYIAMENIEVMTHLLKEIVSFNIKENYANYLMKCKKEKDVKQYFKLNNEGGMKMEVDLAKVIQKETIKLDMAATTKDEALKELTELLYDTGVLSNKEAFLEDVYYRETLGVTGIGNQIAIPHGKSKFVDKTSIAFGKTRADIKWESLDDNPVHFIILFAVTESDKNSVHVRLLSKVAAKLGDDEVCEALLKAKTPEEVYDIFTRTEEI